MLNFVILFTAGIVSLCVLFTSLIIFPKVFPIINAVYLMIVMIIVLIVQYRIQKRTQGCGDAALSDIQRTKFIAVFNIIIPFFVIIVLVFKHFTSKEGQSPWKSI